MLQNQDWTEAFKEFCLIVKPENPEDALKGIPEIRHQDLWHNQTEHLDEEYPWASDTIFYNFKCRQIRTVGLNVQECLFEVDIIYVLDTIADTYHKSDNQAKALLFMERCKRIHHLFQGRSGENFSAMNRTNIYPIPAAPELIVMAQTYETIIMDYTGMREKGEATISSATINGDQSPNTPADWQLFKMNNDKDL
jgi:hypothetical protein